MLGGKAGVFIGVWRLRSALLVLLCCGCGLLPVGCAPVARRTPGGIQLSFENLKSGSGRLAPTAAPRAGPDYLTSCIGMQIVILKGCDLLYINGYNIRPCE
jgi:hypothetical protein